MQTRIIFKLIQKNTCAKKEYLYTAHPPKQTASIILKGV